MRNTNQEGVHVVLTAPQIHSNRLSGKERDRETGLSDHGARLYDAQVGYWVSVDKARQFSNLYSYTGNNHNPTNGVDINGESVIKFKIDLLIKDQANSTWKYISHNAYAVVDDKSRKVTASLSYAPDHYARQKDAFKRSDLDIKTHAAWGLNNVDELNAAQSAFDSGEFEVVQEVTDQAAYKTFGEFDGKSGLYFVVPLPGVIDNCYSAGRELENKMLENSGKGRDLELPQGP